MTFDNFNMYLATIPDYEDDDDNSIPVTPGKKQATGSINLFDIAARYGGKNK